MGKNAFVMGFLPALTAGLLMGYLLNAYPGAMDGKAGSDVKNVGYSDSALEESGDVLLPVVFILMILAALRFIFNLGALGLLSSLLGYAGMLMVMSSAWFFGFLYMFLGGTLCLASGD